MKVLPVRRAKNMKVYIVEKGPIFMVIKEKKVAIEMYPIVEIAKRIPEKQFIISLIKFVFYFIKLWPIC
jgi:hypothetical protein